VTPLNLAAQGVNVSATQAAAFSGTAVATFTVNNAQAQPGDFTAVINWGDNTSLAGTIAAVNGGFQVVGSHTYAQAGSFTVTTTVTAVSTAGTATPVTATASSTATVQASSANAVWINSTFADLLGRAATASDLQVYQGLIDNGVSLELIARDIQYSPEGLNHTVASVYQQYLGRPVDADGLASATSFLMAGHTVQQLSAILLSSDEYFNAANKGGGTNDGFLNALYTDVLGRAVDAGAQPQLSQELQNGVSRTTMALWVLESNEGLAVQVENLYEQYLNRAPTNAELDQVATALQAGASEQSIIAEIHSFAEYSSGPTAP
jgi:hypothetical protein